MAILAMVRLNSLFLNYNTAGGMPTFITKFRDALHDLKDAKEPLSDKIAKSILLSKVHDNNYRHIVDALMVSPSTLEECMQRFLDKHNMLTQNRPSNDTRKANNANQQSGNKGSNKNKSNHKAQVNNAGNKGSNNQNNGGGQYKDSKWWINPDEWKKMSSSGQEGPILTNTKHTKIRTTTMVVIPTKMASPTMDKGQALHTQKLIILKSKILTMKTTMKKKKKPLLE